MGQILNAIKINDLLKSLITSRELLHQKKLTGANFFLTTKQMSQDLERSVS